MYSFNGEVIKEYRNQSGLTQQDLAEAVDISVRKIQDIENQSSDTKVSSLIKICRVLELPLQAIIKSPIKNLDDYIKVYKPIMDMLPVPVEVSCTSAKLFYSNTHGMKLRGFETEDQVKGFDLWKDVPEEQAETLKKYVNYILTMRPTPSPYVGFLKMGGSERKSVTVNWNYIYCDSKKLLGFLSVLTGT